MKSTKRFYLIGLLLIAMLSLAACGGGAAASAPAANDQDTTTGSVAAEAGAQSAGEPTEIRISYIQKFSDLNPLNVNNPAALGVALGLFDTLVRVDNDGTVIPWLADSWDISEDQLTITFHLHEGVMFSDGTPVNADAVIFSAELFQDPDLFLGTSIPSLVAWKALDEYTVQFTFSQPDATALYKLADGDTSILSPTAYQASAEEFAIHPVGSGPYTLDHWEPGVEVVMVKNPNYWQEGVGLADRVVWRNFADGAAAVLAAQSGELDLLHEQEPKDVPLLEAIDGFKVGTDQSGWFGLVLNTAIPPFAKLENRQALAYAINYDAIINVAFEGYAIPGDGLIPPGSWAYEPREPLQYDPDKAKELLAAAGNPDGFDFKVSVTPQPFRSQILEIMQSSLSELGINLEIEVNQFARHVEILRQDHNAANAGFVVQQTLHSDPAMWLRLYAGCNALVGMTEYCDPNDATYDDLIVESTTLFDNAERKTVLQEANEIAMRDLPVIPYAFQQTIHAWNADKLGDYETTFVGGYNYLYLQPKSE